MWRTRIALTPALPTLSDQTSPIGFISTRSSSRPSENGRGSMLHGRVASGLGRAGRGADRRVRSIDLPPAEISGELRRTDFQNLCDAEMHPMHPIAWMGPIYGGAAMLRRPGDQKIRRAAMPALASAGLCRPALSSRSGEASEYRERLRLQTAGCGRLHLVGN